MSALALPRTVADPATAHYDHDELKGEWRDLPVASFADAGTNVPTGLLRIVVR